MALPLSKTMPKLISTNQRTIKFLASHSPWRTLEPNKNNTTYHILFQKKREKNISEIRPPKIVKTSLVLGSTILTFVTSSMQDFLLGSDCLYHLSVIIEEPENQIRFPSVDNWIDSGSQTISKCHQDKKADRKDLMSSLIEFWLHIWDG